MTAITIDDKLLDVIQEPVYGYGLDGFAKQAREHNLQVINNYLEKTLEDWWKGKGSFTYVPSSKEEFCARSGILIVNDKPFAFKATYLGNLTIEAWGAIYRTKK